MRVTHHCTIESPLPLFGEALASVTFWTWSQAREAQKSIPTLEIEQIVSVGASPEATSIFQQALFDTPTLAREHEQLVCLSYDLAGKRLRQPRLVLRASQIRQDRLPAD